MSKPTFGSLFAGIGGIDLGLERAGWECRWQAEIDDYCRAVLTKHWPDVPKYGDIRELTGQELEPTDLICGGFPCQPVSLAGRRRGKSDERWLWPEFARILRLLRPRFVLMENVPGLLSAGMGDVLGDLACLGYDAEWESLPAAAFGAPHLRYRVFLVAYAGGRIEPQQQTGTRPPPQHIASGNSKNRDVADATSHLRGTSRNDRPESPDRSRAVVAHAGYRTKRAQSWTAWSGKDGKQIPERAQPRRDGAKIPHSHAARLEVRQSIFGYAGTQRPPIERSDRWAVEPDVGRVAHGVPNRVDRLKALGNAVVPQVAEWVGKRILGAWKETP